jgi:hypothetical protein
MMLRQKRREKNNINNMIADLEFIIRSVSDFLGVDMNGGVQ